MMAEPHTYNFDGIPRATTPYVPQDVLAEGRRSAQVKDEQPPSALSQWFEQHLRPALESAAHPQTLEDVANLLMGPTDATRGVGMAVVKQALGKLKTVASAAPSAAKATTSAAIRATAAVGDVIDPDVVGVVSPRAGKVLSLAQRLRDKMATAATTSAAPAGTPGVGLAPVASATPRLTPTSTTAALETARQAASVTNLTSEERQALDALVTQGYGKQDVLAQIAQHRAAEATVAAPQTPPQTTPGSVLSTSPGAAGATRTADPMKPVIPAAEVAEYRRLRDAGKTEQEALELLDTMRALQQRFGTPTTAASRGAVADRNATGRWREEE